MKVVVNNELGQMTIEVQGLINAGEDIEEFGDLGNRLPKRSEGHLKPSLESRRKDHPSAVRVIGNRVQRVGEKTILAQ